MFDQRKFVALPTELLHRLAMMTGIEPATHEVDVLRYGSQLCFGGDEVLRSLKSEVRSLKLSHFTLPTSNFFSRRVSCLNEVVAESVRSVRFGFRRSLTGTIVSERPR